MKELILDERELVRRCVTKDRHAQEFLFNQFYDELYHVGLRYLSDHHYTEDAIIQAFSRVFNNIHKFTFTGKGSLGKWIRTIVINESIRILKKRNVLQFGEDITNMEAEYKAANALEELEASDLLLMIERMPAGYRTVFNLYVVEGYSHKEIAKSIGISEGTSKSQLSKARSFLIQKIKEEKSYGTI